MAIKIITASGAENTATLVLASVDGLEVGACIRIYKTGNNKIDGRRQILTVDEPTKTITFTSNSIGTVAPFNPPNAGLVLLTTWVDDADVLIWLGIDVATTNDTDFVATCVEAGNDWAYRKRQQAGYHDSRCIIPSPSVKEGTLLYCATLYRERGSVDSFASFDSMALTGGPSMSLGRIMQLLGINRSQVA